MATMVDLTIAGRTYQVACREGEEDSLRAAAHTIFSQNPMTFPLGEYLAIKMQHYYHFEKNPMTVENAHIALPTGPGFNVQLDPAKILSQRTLAEPA